MAETPEIWLFAAANLLVIVIGGALTALSLAAARRSPDNPAFRGAVVGFGAITLGSVVEGLSELVVRDAYDLGRQGILTLHSVEGILVAAGLAALFYSLRQY